MIFVLFLSVLKHVEGQEASFQELRDHYNRATSIIPSKYRLKADENGRIIGSPDSVLTCFEFDIQSGSEADPRARNPLLASELSKCKNLIAFGKNQGIPKDFSFDFLSGLRYFEGYHLTENTLESLFSTATELEECYVTSEGKIPNSISKLKKLKYLRFSFQGNFSIPKSIVSCEALWYVQVDGYRAGYDDAIWSLPSLTVLEITGGNITMPTNKTAMAPLKILYINRAESVMFTKNIAKLDSLQLMYVDRIQQKMIIPKQFRKLKSVIGLKMHYCSMDRLPDVRGMENLEELHFLSCGFDLNTLSLVGKKHLKHMSLSSDFDGPFDSFDEYIPKNAPAGFREMTQFPKGMEDLVSLKSLCTGMNKITTIPAYFSELKSLMSMFIAETKLDFEGVKQLYRMLVLTKCTYDIEREFTEEENKEIRNLQDKTDRWLGPSTCYDSDFEWTPKYSTKYKMRIK